MLETYQTLTAKPLKYPNPKIMRHIGLSKQCRPRPDCSTVLMFICSKGDFMVEKRQTLTARHLKLA